MTRFYNAETYREMFGQGYTAYIWDSYRRLKKLIPADVKSILSIGCGTGEIEALMPYDFGLHDPYSPVVEYRQEPTGQYDYSIAHGCVMSAAKPNEKREMIELALSHAPAFLVHTGYKDIPHSDDCITYYEWDEETLFQDFNWSRVNKSYIEVCHAA